MQNTACAKGAGVATTGARIEIVSARTIFS